MFGATVTTALEHGAEGIDVVAQVRRGVDQRIAHARLRGHVRDVGDLCAAKQSSGRGRVGKIERLAVNADLLQPGRPRALERDIVIRVEAVDGDHLGAVFPQPVRKVHADEAGRTGHEDLHDPRPRSVSSSARNFAYFEKLLKQPIEM